MSNFAIFDQHKLPNNRSLSPLAMWNKKDLYTYGKLCFKFSMAQLLVMDQILMLIKTELNGDHTPSCTANEQSLEETFTIN